MEAVAAIPGIIYSQAELREFKLLNPATKAVAFIKAPMEDGIKCMKCKQHPKIYRQVGRMQWHLQEAHGWKSDWKKGGDVVRKAEEPCDVPWMTGVRCQRFFPSRAASGWFEVRRASEPTDGWSGQPGVVEDIAKRIEQMHQAQEEKFRKKTQARIRVANEKKEPNPWIERTGWARHLEGLSLEKLREAAGPIIEGEAELQRMWDVLDRVMDAARATATAQRVGLAALFKI